MQGKTIVITGGNAGIGLATAMLFAQNGANVAIIGRRADRNAEALAQLHGLAGACAAFSGDVADKDFLQSTMQRVVDQFGGLHYAFNNAGIEQGMIPLPQQTEEEFQKIYDINVKGVWLSMQAEIPHVLASGGGCIVNTSSMSGHVGLAQVSMYTASKHAILGLTKSVALEYAAQGVRVNAVSPGLVSTELLDRLVSGNPQAFEMVRAMIPMGRFGGAEEVAKAVLYLCRDATYTTGHALVVDGGWTVP